MNRHLLCTASALLFAAVLMVPWHFAVAGKGEGPPADILRKHHIPLTRAGILGALSDPDPKIRWVAAAELADEKATDTVADIEKALESEQVPTAQVNMAYALARLNDERGRDYLRTRCARPGHDGASLMATQYMVSLHESDACAGGIVATLESAAYKDTWGDALRIAPGLENLSEKDSQSLFDLAVERLTGTEPYVEMCAAHALADMGRPEAIPALQNAISNAGNDVLRGDLQRALKKLQENQH
jgi:hypothetical protein